MFVKKVAGIAKLAIVSSLITANAAWAEAASTANGQAGQSVNQIVLLVVLLGAMYFMMIRPQQKKAKEARDLLAGLQKGDEVTLTSGIVGKIVELKDQYTLLQVNNSTEVLVQKQAIVQVLPKGTMKALSGN